MGRKKGAFSRLQPGLKVKTIPPPPPPPQPGTYGFKMLATDGLGQEPIYRETRGLVEAESQADATEQVFKKVPPGWRVVKLTMTFIGTIALLIWAAGRMLA